ncbi:MAG: response regulator [Candidatus Korarchaeota archaeon]|nr:response regulator [Candidatus Korarchaeota archaeon]NIU84978.1 response regulator [Candidatus Thorarchaeota archaeon]NIW15001.1 response regulator [Candidatus Thorarchaeota archaeon]NIW53011.1 response regulator [Candidatus Korarchaeota archaeon]
MGKRILVVDDDDNVRESIRTLLKKEGYTIKTAKSTTDAWETLSKWRADLIILDILFPGENIKEFVKKVDKRSASKILYLSVFAHSAAEDLGYIELSENVLGYIEKPFSIPNLLKKVKTAFAS